MGAIEARLDELGIALPPPLVFPDGFVPPFVTVNVRGARAIIAGHGPAVIEGESERAKGILGHDLDVERGYQVARACGLAMLGSLQRELGTLDRVTGWVKALGMVRCTPDFEHQPQVINGFSDLIIEVFGPEVGRHARSAVGMSSLPFGIPVEIEGEVLIADAG